MYKQFAVALFIAVCSLGLLPGRASANLIVNGDFNTVVPRNSTGGGWSSFNIDLAGGHRTTGGLPDAMFIINNGGAFGTDPRIQQLVSGLTAGATYTLTGNYANVYNCCGSRGANTFAVDIDGVNLDMLDYPGVNVWGSFSYNIIAPDTDLLIAFRSEINGDDTEYKIDNISLVESQAAPIPEPATMFLVLSGGAALLRSRRKAPRH
jgi:hypothetical protein